MQEAIEQQIESAEADIVEAEFYISYYSDKVQTLIACNEDPRVSDKLREINENAINFACRKIHEYRLAQAIIAKAELVRRN